MTRSYLYSTSLWALALHSPDQPSGSPEQTNKSAEAPKPTEPAAKTTTTPAAGAPATPAQAKTGTQPSHHQPSPQAKTGGSNVQPLHKSGQGPAAKTGKAPEKGKTAKKAPEKKGRGSVENQDLRTRVWNKFKGGTTQTVQQLAKDLNAPEKKIRSSIDALRAMKDRPDGREAGVKFIHNIGRNMFSITNKPAKGKSA